MGVESRHFHVSDHHHHSRLRTGGALLCWSWWRDTGDKALPSETLLLPHASGGTRRDESQANLSCRVPHYRPIVSAVLTNIIALGETQNMDPFINIFYIFLHYISFNLDSKTWNQCFENWTGPAGWTRPADQTVTRPSIRFRVILKTGFELNWQTQSKTGKTR